MAAVLAFLGTLLMSLVVALLAAFQLGDFFGLTNELVPVIAATALFAVAAMVLLAIGYATAQGAGALNWIAFALAALVVGLASSPRLGERIAERATSHDALGLASVSIRLEILLPGLLVVLVQWGLVRRRWLRAAGEEDLSLWPWVTTVIAGLAILNPLGLALIWIALHELSTAGFSEFAAITTGGGALVVMGLTECYIRGRMLRRRLAAGPPAMGGAAKAPG